MRSHQPERRRPQPVTASRSTAPSTATPKLRQFLTDGHTSAEDAGRIAAEAGVGTLVLSHLLPGDQPEVTDEIWTAEASKHFGGRIVVGHDLMLI